MNCFPLHTSHMTENRTLLSLGPLDELQETKMKLLMVTTSLGNEQGCYHPELTGVPVLCTVRMLSLFLFLLAPVSSS